MKKIFLICVLCLFFSGCQDLKFWVSHQKSSLVGLNRSVKIYSPLQGNLIAEYNTKSKIEWGDNNAHLFSMQGKRIDIYGEFIMVVEEY